MAGQEESSGKTRPRRRQGATQRNTKSALWWTSSKKDRLKDARRGGHILERFSRKVGIPLLGERSSLGSTRNFTQSFGQQNLFRMCMQTAVWSLGADKSCIYSAHLRTARQRAYRARVGTEIHLDRLARAVSRTLTGPVVLMRYSPQSHACQ